MNELPKRLASAHDTLDHLFRHESGKMKSVLARIFGSHNIELIEDAVQDALVRAVEQWGIKGIPANPSAWLIEVAKNRMYDVLRRNARMMSLADNSETAEASAVNAVQPLTNESDAYAFDEHKIDEQIIDEQTIDDDLLKMMFACCHPSARADAQITLILKILCGFSTVEIARAFLTNEETIQKRLYRAKELFRKGDVPYRIPSASELPIRLASVLQAIYLLFNEGYTSTYHDDLIRRDVMAESFRLCEILSEHPQTNAPEVFALMALICFHAARTKGRLDAQGNIVLLRDQDRSLWNRTLIEQGIVYLGRSAAGGAVSRFHCEAGIAYEHCIAASVEATAWENVLRLYDVLLRVAPTPIAALNRAVVVAEVYGAEDALKKLQSIRSAPLEGYYLYHALVGDMLRRLGRSAEAKPYLEHALSLTQSPAEQRLLQMRLSTIV